MRELRPPEADRPARLLGDRRARGEHDDALGLVWVQYVDLSGHLAGSFPTQAETESSPCFAATGSMLSSIRNCSSSEGSYSFIRATTRRLCALGLRPVGVRDDVEEELDVPALPVPHLTTDRAAMTDVEDGLCGEAGSQLLDVRQPLGVEAVREVAVAVVVDLVAEEDDLLVLTQGPRAVVRGLARAEVDDGEGDAVEGQALPVARSACSGRRASSATRRRTSAR